MMRTLASPVIAFIQLLQEAPERLDRRVGVVHPLVGRRLALPRDLRTAHAVDFLELASQAYARNTIGPACPATMSDQRPHFGKQFAEASVGLGSGHDGHMEPLTLFTWGYWGWGNSTGQLIEAVDAVEGARGFGAPLFVDIRLSRSVRAPGFNGRAFEEAVGASRYRWMPDLGNLAVQDGGDEPIKIKNPAAAETLLDIADEAARDNRRVVFFCACETPGVDGEVLLPTFD